MALTLSDVTFAYGPGSTLAVTAVRDLCFHVERGEFVLVLGVTGSGKSTMLRIASGLLEPQSGRVSLDGAPLTQRSARGNVGLIFQDAESQLFADTLSEDVVFGPRNLGLAPSDAEAAAHAALQRVGLDPAVFGERSPFSLSGGEARRAAIAGVLAMHPRYLLADEPTAGLDARGRERVRALLLDARQEAGVVVVSHSADEFLEYADRVLLLAGGESVWWGSAQELVQCPGRFAEAGLFPPDVLELQRLGRDGGSLSEPFTLDVDEIVQRLKGSLREQSISKTVKEADAE